MAAKYQLITELYRRTGKTVTRNPQAWQSFLSSACRNYKCRFDEQLLIYAQRPDAVAVAKIETWNRQFKRWVNKDSKGIAVFDPKGRRNTLKYYFDVSDTHEGYYGSRPVPIWQMNEGYEQAVIERLSDRFGEVENESLAEVLMETAKNAVEDNLQDYTAQLKGYVKDSFLEELDDFNIEVIYKRLVVNGVAFMLMSRCGIDTEEYFDREDFADIINFNTPQTLNAIGIATSDIAEMALREISLSIRNVQMEVKDQNRTFAQHPANPYDIGRKQPERSENNERNHLHQTGGLSYSRPHITDRARNSAWQVRYDAQGLSGAAQADNLPQSANIGQTERASVPDRAERTPEIGASDEAALQGTGRDRGAERKSTDAVARTDEQYPQSSRGNDTERTDLQVTDPELSTESVANESEVVANLPNVEEQIEMMMQAEDEKSSAFVISQEDIDSVLQKGSGFASGKYRIYRQFQKGEDKKSNIEFLKNEYGTGGGGHTFPDGFAGHSWHDSKGLAIDRNGTYTNHDLVLKWSEVEKRLRELIKADRYLNPKEKEHYPAFLESVSAPEYEIDTHRKMAKQRFIESKRELPPADKRDTLSLRLSDFIRDLSGYEKDLLSEVERGDLADVTAEEMKRHLSDPATVQELLDFLSKVQWKTSDTYSRSNAYRFSEELRELHPLRYLYNEGDVVYIGADKYEITAFNENAVSLQNVEFPLFGKEYSREDFEEKLKENPANDHLKVVVTEKQRTETPSEEKPDGIKFSIGFSEHPAFYDRQLNDRYTDLSFALGNKLLGILDEKQHRERESKEIGWYHKTDFEITATIGGEDFHYDGRFDIGDGEGDLIAHIKNFYDYSLSPNCPFIAAELCELNRNMMLSVDIIPVPTDEAVREVENRLLGVETNITNWQRKQNQNNNFSAVIPYDLEQQRKESKEFLDDLTTRDQRMMFAVLTMVHTADTKEQLDNDTEALLTTARKHLCQFAVLKYQQMDGLNTALPFGVRKIDALRTLTTESLAVFIPFRVQEIYHENGVYYGQNVISKNMIIANRRQLLNGNSFILGVSGAGKSFTAKEEMTNIILTDPNADIIIIDPEREYSPLVKAMQGEVIHISATSENHINAMDMNSDYGDGANPVILKSEFILSLCEQLIGGTNLGAKQKSIIDRCTASVYRYYQQGNYMGTPPTLQDFREELLKQNEPEAQEIALAIELFTDGSLNTFAKHTNVDTHSRLICYDILDLGKQLQPIGMLVVLDSILNRITQNRAKGRNTFIFIDEIYLLFQHEYSANFLFTLWKRVRKYGAYCTGITQNVDDLLQSHTARTMLANSEFIIMLNQASTDRLELAKLLNISDLQMSYITNVGAGQGLLKVGSSLVPFVNKFPRNTELYKLMTTKFGEV